MPYPNQFEHHAKAYEYLHSLCLCSFYIVKIQKKKRGEDLEKGERRGESKGSGNKERKKRSEEKEWEGEEGKKST